MRRIALGLAALLAAAATPAGMRVAFAHGGSYRGPAGEVPPDSRTPADPPPPDAGGGTPTPPEGGGGTPTPPPGGGGTPTPPGDGGGTPDGSGEPGGSAPGGGPTGPKTPTGRPTGPRPVVTYDSWRFWWAHNRDRILGEFAGTADPRSGSGLAALSDGGNDNEALPEGLTARSLEARVVPLLLGYAGNDATGPEVRGACLLALAKIGRPEVRPLCMRLARSGGVLRTDAQVEETAVLSLGVLQERSPATRAFLAEVAADPAARIRTRCFAAFALGLLADRDASDPATLGALRDLVRDPGTPRDLRASALVGIGLLGDPTAVPDLLRWLADERVGSVRLDDLTLSFVAAAVGKIGKPASPAVVDALGKTLLRRHRYTRYSTVIALGQVAPFAGTEKQALCVRTLGQVVRSDGKEGFDTAAADFALIALGRAGAGTEDAGVRQAAILELRDAFENRPRLRPFAALGMGILGRGLAGPARAGLAEDLREAFARASGDPEPRGALAVALGLLRDDDARGNLEAALRDEKMTSLRGASAVALGLLGNPASVGPVHRALVEKGDRDLLLDTSLAAGLLRDAEAVPHLVQALEETQTSVCVQGAAAAAIGRIGDRRAVEPLCAILEDPKGQYDALIRALAAVSLGQIGDRSPVPVLSILSEDVNYRAYYDALGEVLTIL